MCLFEKWNQFFRSCCAHVHTCTMSWIFLLSCFKARSGKHCCPDFRRFPRSDNVNLSSRLFETGFPGKLSAAPLFPFRSRIVFYPDVRAAVSVVVNPVLQPGPLLFGLDRSWKSERTLLDRLIERIASHRTHFRGNL